MPRYCVLESFLGRDLMTEENGKKKYTVEEQVLKVKETGAVANVESTEVGVCQG